MECAIRNHSERPPHASRCSRTSTVQAWARRWVMSRSKIVDCHSARTIYATILTDLHCPFTSLQRRDHVRIVTVNKRVGGRFIVALRMSPSHTLPGGISALYLKLCFGSFPRLGYWLKMLCWLVQWIISGLCLLMPCPYWLVARVHSNSYVCLTVQTSSWI